MNKELYYVCINGGDGSAYPSFVENKELAEWIEGHENEGFTEAAGSLTLKSDSPIEIDGLETKETYYLESVGDEWTDLSKKEVQEYIDIFFDGVKPIFEVRDSDKEGFTSTYGEKTTFFYADIYYNDILVTTNCYREGISREHILKQVNWRE